MARQPRPRAPRSRSHRAVASAEEARGDPRQAVRARHARHRQGVGHRPICSSGGGQVMVVDVLVWIFGTMFAVAALLAVIRIIRGPSIIDRMVASDALLTILICVLVADMIIRGHTDTLPLVLALAMTAFIASIAVARHVTRQEANASERF
ncbi:monovalent cation/H+ antiporter complex subunit F [Pseudoclavibacter helvolus]